MYLRHIELCGQLMHEPAPY